MATDRYYTKIFNNGKALADYLNYAGVNPIEEGTGYVNSNVLTAVTQTNFPDWQDTDGNGTNISGKLLISGGANGTQYASISSVPSASSVGATHANIGSALNPVNYRIYSADPTWSFTIVDLRIGPHGIILVWKNSGSLHF